MPTKKKSGSKKIAQPSSWNKFAAKITSFAKKHRIISVILAIALLWGLVWLGQVAVERYQFYQVEKSLSSIANDISKETGANSITKERSCAYSSAKFSKGTLRCSTGYNLKVSVNNTVGANSAVQKINSTIVNNRDTSELTAQYSIKKVFEEKDANDHTESIDADIKLSQSGGYSCGVIYRLINESANYYLDTHISCSRTSHIPYFPVKK